MTSPRWTMVEVLLALFIASCHGEFLRVCYMTNWSQYRPGDARFTVASINDASVCTHVILAFAGINALDNTLAPLEMNDDIAGGTYQKLAELRDSNPGLKVLLAVGGWNHGSGPFVEVVSNTEKMGLFADNVVSFIRRIKFDGVDIDWEWPAQRGSNSSDKERFTSLMQTLRVKIDAESTETGFPPLLLTVAVGASQYIVDDGYEVDKISRAVDFLSVMTYDMDVSRGSRLLHHAPLYSRPGDSEEEKRYSVDYTVNYWLNKGAPRGKVVVGLPFYGRYFRLLSPSMTDLYDRADGSSSSSYSYYQICRFAQNSSWSRVWDNVSKVPFIYNNDIWIGYDDVQSMESKASYIRQERLAGAMIWEMGQDDFSGRFCNQGSYPLLKKIKEVLTASKDNCESGTYGSLSESGCTPCSKGSYQPLRRMTECELCGPGKTTFVEGTNVQYKCVDTCSVGYEYNYLKKTCTKCRLGFTRSRLSSAYCVKCPADFTTMTAGDSTCVPLPEGVPAPVLVDLMYHFTLTFTTTTCENRDVIVGAISAGVWRVMTNASGTWPDLCSRRCDNVKTVRMEGCEGEARKRRDNHLSHLTVRALIEKVPEVIRSAPDGAGVTMTRTTDSVMTELFFDKDIFNTLNVYGIHYAGMTEHTMEKLCRKTGYVFNSGQCVPCPAGTYKQTTTRRCIACPVGEYQEHEAQTECEDCPGPTATLESGGDSVQKCLSPCAMDANYCENNGVCQWREESLKVFCQCAEPYFGERCDLRTDAQKEDLVPIIGGVVGGLGSVTLVIVVMVVCCLCYRRHAKSQNESSSIGEANDVMYMPGVMANDFLPTPTVIAADPLYYDDSFIMADNHRSRGVISDATFRTPTVVQLDNDSPRPTNGKTDRKASANDKPDGSKATSEAVDENKLSKQSSNDVTAEKQTVYKNTVVDADVVALKPAPSAKENKVLELRM